MITGDTLARAQSDVGVFAEALIGQPLWPHQAQLARSTARIRSVCSGRQAGKSRTLSVLALHEAFRAPGRRVLIVSAADAAARDLLDECSALASGPMLAGSIVDDNASLITLSNGSTVRSVPASEKQIRGKSIDLLIIDEAAFVGDDIWRAAQYTIIGRPGSRVVMASTPWGRRDRFFAVAYGAGLRGVDGYESFHWPSTASPLVDPDLLGMWRETATDREYRAEVLAEWVEADGAYFTADELEAAVVDVELVDPATGYGLVVDVGVDWGRWRDATAIVGIGPLHRDHPASGARGLAPLCPLWLEELFRAPFDDVIARIVAAGSHRDGLRYGRVVSEQNGIGEMPTETLRHALVGSGAADAVEGVYTDARRKETGFGAIKLLLGQGRLVLPRHPELLRQLSALEFESLEGGSVRIAVPARAGHDDLAMAFQLAITPRVGDAREWAPVQEVRVGHYSIGDPTRGTRSVTTWIDEGDDAVGRLAARVMDHRRAHGFDEDPAEAWATAEEYLGRGGRRGRGRR